MAEALATAGRATVDELLPTVYADVRDELLPVARKSLWAHLRKLDDRGRGPVRGPRRHRGGLGVDGVTRRSASGG